TSGRVRNCRLDNRSSLNRQRERRLLTCQRAFQAADPDPLQPAATALRHKVNQAI
ncbi:unnamed protein product, partial [Nesidiocoris tenuis]